MNTIKFLGTAGARVVVSQQMRASGGIWLSLDETNIYLDPGPGALIRCLSSRPKLNPQKLDAIILSHKHLDHSSDINIMIEAMTDTGKNKKGTLFITEDALQSWIPLKYLRDFVGEIVLLEENKIYTIKNVNFTTPLKHIHQDCETYGIKFLIGDKSISFITDTRFFPGLISAYNSDIIVINTIFLERRDYDHLCLDDVKKIISEIKPKCAILTHFGMSILSAKPHIIAEKLSESSNIKVIAARDGMLFDIDKIWES